MVREKTIRSFLVCSTAVLLCLALAGCPAREPEVPEREVSLAASQEFITSEEGLVSLEETYDFQFGIIYEMAIGLTHEALRQGDVDAAIGYATDGKIKEIDLLLLEDDRGAFPARNPAPVIQGEVLEKYPQIETVLAEVARQLDSRAMSELNFRADIEEEEHADVAMDWLLEKELISRTETFAPGEEPVRVGSKEFTEQLILRYITIYALQDAGIPVEDQMHRVGTGATRAALLYGDIDLYWEYTGVAWNSIFGEEEIIADSDRVFEKVAARDAETGLIWLQYAPLNKTYTVMMYKDQAETLEINTLSEFALWVKQVQAGEY